MPQFYANPSPTYQPAMRLISSITRSNPAVVTTTFAHDYISGEIIRLLIPRNWGMQQANNLYAPIVVTGDTTFTIAIDTTAFDSLAEPTPVYQAPQAVPIGEINSTLLASTVNVLPTGVR